MQSEAFLLRAPGPDRAFSLSIVLPVYNERDRVVEGLNLLSTAINEGALGDEQVEVVLADDGSTDGTAAVAECALAAFAHATIVRIPLNSGKGAAVRAGVAAARGSRLVYMDVDMAVPPCNLGNLLRELVDADVVIGSRTHQRSRIESATFHRMVMGRTFHRIARATAGLPYRDTQCGFKAFRTPVARLLFHWLTTDRFAFDVELLALARRLDFSVVEVPVFWRHVAGSRIRPFIDPFSMLADLVRLRMGTTSPPEVKGMVIPAGDAKHDAAERLRKVVGPTLPILCLQEGLLVLFPLCDDAGVDRLGHIIRGEFAQPSLETVALSIPDLEARRGTLADSGPLTTAASASDTAHVGQPCGNFACEVGEGDSSASGS